MTTRRRLLKFGLLAIVATLVGMVCLLWPEDSSAINRENAARIRQGMTLDEIETILGGPGRHEFGGPLSSDVQFSLSNDEIVAAHRFVLSYPANTVALQRWQSKTVTIDIPFDAQGVALQVRYILHRPDSETFLQMVRRVLHL
jgi:hypothetical protein